MPASTKLRVSVYRHHKPSGLVAVRIEGRDMYLGRHSTPESRAEYKRVIAEWLANHRTMPGCLTGNARPGALYNIGCFVSCGFIPTLVERRVGRVLKYLSRVFPRPERS